MIEGNLTQRREDAKGMSAAYKASPSLCALASFARGIFFLFLFLLSQHSLFAQTGGVASVNRAGDRLTLKIAVMGPGNEFYFWFGHIGLVVEDKASGQSRFFDWGVFSFDNENFFVNFAYGRLLYSCMVSRAEANYKNYVYHNRSITLYTLDLPADKKEEILRFAENNVLPENRDYYYHHFRDNCATKIRDILDMAVDGKFRAEFGEAPGRFTYRQHVRRHTWFSPFMDWICNFWMGQDIDKPIKVWDEMFLPSEIALRMKDFRYTGPDGTERPLVSGVEIINSSSTRPAVLDKPRLQWPRELFASLLFSALLVFLYLLRGKRKAFKVFMGLLQSFFGLFFGIVGSALLFMNVFTNHDYTYHNSNIFFVNPLFLALIPLGLVFAFGKGKKKQFVSARLIRSFWSYVLLGGLLTMAIKFSPAFYQQNQVDQALILPLALTMVLLFSRMGRPGLLTRAEAVRDRK